MNSDLWKTVWQYYGNASVFISKSAGAALLRITFLSHRFRGDDVVGVEKVTTYGSVFGRTVYQATRSLWYNSQFNGGVRFKKLMKKGSRLFGIPANIGSRGLLELFACDPIHLEESDECAKADWKLWLHDVESMKLRMNGLEVTLLDVEGRVVYVDDNGKMR